MDDIDSLSLCPHCFCCTKSVIYFNDGRWEPIDPKDPEAMCGKCGELKNGQPTN